MVCIFARQALIKPTITVKNRNPIGFQYLWKKVMIGTTLLNNDDRSNRRDKPSIIVRGKTLLPVP